MSSSNNFFELAKTIQDTYSGGSLQGELYALEKNSKKYSNTVLAGR